MKELKMRAMRTEAELIEQVASSGYKIFKAKEDKHSNDSPRKAEHKH